jgi:ribonuclease HI
VFQHCSCYNNTRGVTLIPLDGDTIKYAIQLVFPATNNVAEYEGLITRLRLAKDLGIQRLLIRGDSQLVVKQV